MSTLQIKSTSKNYPSNEGGGGTGGSNGGGTCGCNCSTGRIIPENKVG
jgi:hypothetical protein